MAIRQDMVIGQDMAIRQIVLRIVLVLALLVLVLVLASSALLRLSGMNIRMDNGSPLSVALFGPTGDLASIYNRQALDTDTPAVVLIGASNFTLIPAARLQASLRRAEGYGGYTVSNMSVQGVGMPSFRRIVDLAYDGLPAERKTPAVFVLGLWYGFFSRPADTPFDRGFVDSARRYGLYGVAPNGAIVARRSPAVVDTSLLLLKPLVMFERLFQTVGAFGKSFERFVATGTSGPITRSDDAQNAVRLTAAQKAAMIRMRVEGTERIHPHNFALLQAIAQTVSCRGDRLVIVDLPLPGWHRQAVPAFARFEDAARPWLARLDRLPGVQSVDLTTALADDDFVDSVHPKPLVAERVADALAAEIARERATPRASSGNSSTCS